MCLQHLVLLMRQSALRAVLFRRSSWTCGTSLIELDTALVFRWPPLVDTRPLQAA